MSKKDTIAEMMSEKSIAPTRLAEILKILQRPAFPSHPLLVGESETDLLIGWVVSWPGRAGAGVRVRLTC